MTESETAAQASVEVTQSWYRAWIPRVAVATVTVLAVGYGTTWVAGSASGFFITLVISVFVAFALLPAVELLSRRGWRRGLATGAVMFGGGLSMLVFVAAILNVALREVVDLVGAAPGYVESAVTWANDTFGLELSASTVIDQLTVDEGRLQEIAGDAVSGVLGLASTALGLLFQALTVSLFVFYILADLPTLRSSILRRLPPSQQLHADAILGITIDKVGGYVYSRGLLAFASALFHFAAFTLIGISYPMALAMWVGLVSQFVPTVGTYLAGVFPVLIALTENPRDVLWVLAAIIVYQQVENYALSPRITANTMDLHPAIAFGSVIVGGALLGGVGALLALPVAATATALVQTYADHYDIVSSGTIESPEEYEARMIAAAAEKRGKRADLQKRLRELTRTGLRREGRTIDHV